MMSSDRLLICSDLDGTLIPNGPEPESPGARGMFAALAAHPRVTLAYVSGRHRHLIERAIRNNALPVPDFVIGDVGTSLYHLRGRRVWEQPGRWESAIAGDWRGRGRVELAVLLEGLPGLRLQECDKQNTYKLSYYLDPDADPRVLATEIQRRLGRAGVQVRLIRSIDCQRQSCLLDIVPRGASKLQAIEWLMGQQGFATGNTVFGGDSGNDLDVLASPLQAVVVANAPADIRRRACELADSMGNAAQLYIARGGFMGMNGNYSAGVLEGVAHYFPAVVEWLGIRRMACGNR